MVSTDTLTNEQLRKQKALDYRNYVVVGSFIVKANADRMLRRLQTQYKIKGRMRFNPTNKFYNVYILETDNFDEAVEMERKAETEMGFDDAWLLRVPKKAPPDR
jgi:predicted nucleic acid-binding protein